MIADKENLEYLLSFIYVDLSLYNNDNNNNNSTKQRHMDLLCYSKNR